VNLIDQINGESKTSAGGGRELGGQDMVRAADVQRHQLAEESGWRAEKAGVRVVV